MIEYAAKTPKVPIPFGKPLEPARQSAPRVRRIGFKTPLWALADSSRIADTSVLGMAGEVDGCTYLGQQTPAFYVKQK